MIDNAVAQLVRYAEQTGLIAPEDHVWAVNSLLEMLRLDSYTEPALSDTPIDLPAVLDALLDDAHARGVLENNSIVYRDLFDTALMGRLTPPPREVAARFRALYDESPSRATCPPRPIPNVSYVRKTRAMRAASITPRGRTTGSSLSRSTASRGSCSIPPMCIITSTASA